MLLLRKTFESLQQKYLFSVYHVLWCIPQCTPIYKTLGTVWDVGIAFLGWMCKALKPFQLINESTDALSVCDS